MPALLMLADSDKILHPELSDGMERWCSQLTKVTIHNAGHWALLEQPDQVNKALETWLDGLARSKR